MAECIYLARCIFVSVCSLYLGTEWMSECVWWHTAYENNTESCALFTLANVCRGSFPTYRLHLYARGNCETLCRSMLCCVCLSCFSFGPLNCTLDLLVVVVVAFFARTNDISSTHIQRWSKYYGLLKQKEEEATAAAVLVEKKLKKKTIRKKNPTKWPRT